MTEGIKRDVTKPRIGLLSKIFLWGMATVMTDAVKSGKYPANNWRKGLAWSVAYDAVQRHLTAWWDGEDIDPDSGRSHLWHAGCELMFLAEYEHTKAGTDDRYKHDLLPKT